MADLEPTQNPNPVSRLSFVQLRQAFQNVGIKIIKRALQSFNYVTGISGWKIDADGNVEFNNGTFRGTLEASSINIPNATTADSFHTDNQGNSWWGANVASGIANAVAYITKAGFAKFRSILFDNIAAPTAADGQLWCNTNEANKKVLWGYFGGDTSNKQQISMSRMFAYNEYDNDNTGGGTTQTYDLEIPTWFQPRSVDAKGFFQNSDGSEMGVMYGFAQNGDEGVNTGIKITVATKTNIVSDLSYSFDGDGFMKASGWSTNADPKVPASIDGTGHVTSYYNNTKDLVVADSWNDGTAINGLSWTNNNFLVLTDYRAWQQSDCILSSLYNATRSNLNAYAYILSWTDTKVTIRIVCKAGYRLFAHFNVIG